MTIRTDSYALTPTLYAPVAQYALRGHGAELLPDRSGNGYDLVSTLSPGYAPDGYEQTCLHQGRCVSGAVEALQITGDLTLTVRAWARGGALARQFMNNCNDGTAVASPYTILINLAGQVVCAVEKADQTSYAWTSTLQAKWGRWALYSMRRDVAAGTWTLGVNKTFQTSSSMIVTVPLDGTEPLLYVGGPDVGSELWMGGSVDQCVWDKRLTDAQIGKLCDAIGIEG